jgi:ribosomal subunit interface protein
MSLRISGKQMNVGDALSQRIRERIDDAITKYFGGGFDGHVTMEKNGAFFNCDCMLHLDSGATLQATARENDPVLAFESAADRIEKRLRRYKRRLKSRHGAGQATTESSYTVMEPPLQEEEIPEDYAPAIIAEMAVQSAACSVAEAVMRLDMTDNPVVVFKNAGNGRINVVYRRPDGNIGWVDPHGGK